MKQIRWAQNDFNSVDWAVKPQNKQTKYAVKNMFIVSMLTCLH